MFISVVLEHCITFLLSFYTLCLLMKLNESFKEDIFKVVLFYVVFIVNCMFIYVKLCILLYCATPLYI